MQMREISLMVLDDCECATKNHPANMMMRYHYYAVRLLTELLNHLTLARGQCCVLFSLHLPKRCAVFCLAAFEADTKACTHQHLHPISACKMNAGRAPGARPDRISIEQADQAWALQHIF